MLNMIDGDSKDEKIIAVPLNDPNYNTYSDIKDLPKHVFDEIRHFFSVYKSLENGKETSVAEVSGVKKAKETIKKCIDMLHHRFPNGVMQRRALQGRFFSKQFSEKKNFFLATKPAGIRTI